MTALAPIPIAVTEWVPLSQLHPAPWNPRRIQDPRFQQLCASLQADPAFLVDRPILAQADGTIYAGNMRYRAAEHLGWPEVPARLGNVSEQQAQARALRDNNQFGEWEYSDLAMLLHSLEDAGTDLATLGFAADELEPLLAYDPGAVDTAFEAVHVDQLVVLRAVPVWSLCEHHLLPFRCTLTMGYLTGDRVLGLSKLARVAQQHAHRLQLQERLVADIAAHLQRLAATDDVAVLGRGVHLCMTMRGIRSAGEMVTSALHGQFRDDARTRTEFLALAEGRADG